MTKESKKRETSGEKNFRLYEVYMSTLTVMISNGTVNLNEIGEINHSNVFVSY